MKMGRGKNTLYLQSISKHKPWITYMITPVSAFLTGTKATTEKGGKYNDALENWKYRRNILLFYHKDPNFTFGFPH